MAEKSVLVVLVGTAAGCASYQQPYPSDWPEIAPAVSDCSALSGSYLNEAERLTFGGNTDAYHFYLSSLLESGSYGTVVESSVRVISLDVSSEGLLSYGVNGVPDAANSALTWECDGSHVMRGTSVSRGGSGEDVLNVTETITVELHRAEDGSLVVHQHSQQCGLHFAVIPGCVPDEQWFLFRRSLAAP